MRDFNQFKTTPEERRKFERVLWLGMGILVVVLIAYGYMQSRQPAPENVNIGGDALPWVTFMVPLALLAFFGGLALWTWAMKEKHCHDCAIMKEERKRYRDGYPLPGEKL